LPTNPPVSSVDLPALDPDEIALGETVYAQSCASCHGANLEGQPDWKDGNVDGSFRSPPHDETGHTWHHADAILLDSIRLGGERLGGTMAGKSNMPAFANTLSDEEINTVLTYIKSTWSDDIRLIQWEQTQNQP
jgi:mono/diheme cytochrome c family protein